jgi:enoyl-[acyl-carrier-protein] reductase (NADH)
MFRELGQGLAAHFQADAETVSKQVFQGILQGRPQTTDEIAAAALFLVSDLSSAITGQTLNVDGGMAFY